MLLDAAALPTAGRPCDDQAWWAWSCAPRLPAPPGSPALTQKSLPPLLDFLGAAAFLTVVAAFFTVVAAFLVVVAPFLVLPPLVKRAWTVCISIGGMGCREGEQGAMAGRGGPQAPSPVSWQWLRPSGGCHRPSTAPRGPTTGTAGWWQTHQGGRHGGCCRLKGAG